MFWEVIFILHKYNYKWLAMKMKYCVFVILVMLVSSDFLPKSCGTPSAL